MNLPLSKAQTKTQRLRDQLYSLQGSKCFYCSRAIPPQERTLEHLVPKCEGGAADHSNGVVVCEAINQLLGAATPKQKMQMLKEGGGRIECPNKEHRGHCIGAKVVENPVEAPHPCRTGVFNETDEDVDKPKKPKNSSTLPRRGAAGPRR